MATTQAWPSTPAPPAYPAVTAGQVEDANRRAAQAQAEADALQQQVDAERAQTDAALGRIEELEDRLAEMEATPPSGGGGINPIGSVASPVDPLSSLVDDLRARSGAEVVQEGDMVVLRVPNAFKAGSDTLRGDVGLMTTLNAAADALVRHPQASVAVVGHTDSDPIVKSAKLWQSNEHLSRARAEKVAGVLANQGVSQARISVEGRGSRDPIVFPERSAGDKARNRRVEIMIRM